MKTPPSKVDFQGKLNAEYVAWLEENLKADAKKAIAPQWPKRVTVCLSR